MGQVGTAQCPVPTLCGARFHFNPICFLWDGFLSNSQAIIPLDLRLNMWNDNTIWDGKLRRWRCYAVVLCMCWKHYWVLPSKYFPLFLGYFKISSDFVYVCYSHRPPSPLISSNILALPLRFFCKIVCLFCFAKFCIYVYIVFLVLLLLENKVMQAVAAEPAVALEALPPATFSATFATFASSYIRCYIRYIRLHWAPPQGEARMKNTTAQKYTGLHHKEKLGAEKGRQLQLKNILSSTTRRG